MNLSLFKYQSDEENVFNQVRTIEEDGKIWFCATDVAKCLGYQNPRDAIAKHCKPSGVVIRDVGVRTGTKSDGSPSIQRLQIKFISEGNVYRLISRSQLPSAERFETWLFDEVVPSIRKKGFYGNINRNILPEFVKRYKANLHLIPSDYFSVITELYVRLYSELENVGYVIPDKGAHGKTMTPDISVGKCFAKFLKENNSDLWDKHKTYKHHFPDGRVVDAYMYPIDALPMFIRYINERWLYERAEAYFKKRDPLALDYLPKLLESKKKSA